MVQVLRPDIQSEQGLVDIQAVHKPGQDMIVVGTEQVAGHTAVGAAERQDKRQKLVLLAAGLDMLVVDQGAAAGPGMDMPGQDTQRLTLAEYRGMSNLKGSQADWAVPAVDSQAGLAVDSQVEQAVSAVDNQAVLAADPEEGNPAGQLAESAKGS